MDNDPDVRTDNHDQLIAVMAAIAAGDRAAVVTLYTEFGPRIAGGVRRRLRELGIHNPQDAQVQDLVMDACFELEGCAKSWNPAGGALPWNWARRRIDTMIARSVGIFTDPLDETVTEQLAAPPPPAGGAADRGAAAILDDLAAADGQARLLADAFDGAKVSCRDRAVILEYVLQADLGDPSPALTVGAEFGLEPANVRQIVKRTRAKLSSFAGADSRYRPMADLPFLAS
jgi:DNA-directed RNA polymerase specialized sigma24 family protein